MHVYSIYRYKFLYNHEFGSLYTYIKFVDYSDEKYVASVGVSRTNICDWILGNRPFCHA